MTIYHFSFTVRSFCIICIWPISVVRLWLFHAFFFFQCGTIQNRNKSPCGIVKSANPLNPHMSVKSFSISCYCWIYFAVIFCIKYDIWYIRCASISYFTTILFNHLSIQCFLHFLINIYYYSSILHIHWISLFCNIYCWMKFPFRKIIYISTLKNAYSSNTSSIRLSI